MKRKFPYLYFFYKRHYPIESCTGGEHKYHNLNNVIQMETTYMWLTCTLE